MTKKRFIDQFVALFFDMNGTIMYGHDRLGPDEDFAATYRLRGGTSLDAVTVSASVNSICRCLARDYEDPACFESFPSLIDAVEKYSDLRGDDARDIAGVIADHEVGCVPEWATGALQEFSKTHSLALVTNVWAPETAWTSVLEQSGVFHLFKARVFSSTYGILKPSPRLFATALTQMDVPPSQAVFIGDSLERDIRPAAQLGFATVLVGRNTTECDADLVVDSIAELLTC